MLMELNRTVNGPTLTLEPTEKNSKSRIINSRVPAFKNAYLHTYVIK